ncbi:MAG: DoxX family protein [Chloroflexota bacterium]|nr:DoxX family protein [Chloroflexota bacterium]
MEIAYLAVQGLLALAFLMSGGSKVAGAKMHVENFDRWRYPQAFRPVVGAVEVLGAAGMVVGIWAPLVAFAAAVWLAPTMVGAVYTHLVRAKDRGYPAPGVLLVLAAVVAVGRWQALLDLLP